MYSSGTVHKPKCWAPGAKTKEQKRDHLQSPLVPLFRSQAPLFHLSHHSPDSQQHRPELLPINKTQQDCVLLYVWLSPFSTSMSPISSALLVLPSCSQQYNNPWYGCSHFLIPSLDNQDSGHIQSGATINSAAMRVILEEGGSFGDHMCMFLLSIAKSL